MDNDIVYKLALTFSQKELAGMYAIINQREAEHLKEIKSLRLILESHGQVIEKNAGLKFELVGVTDRLRIKEEENARLREIIEDNIVMMEKMQERENKMIKLEEENARLLETLELIAAPKRADGTYNRCREACEQLANNALKRG